LTAFLRTRRSGVRIPRAHHLSLLNQALAAISQGDLDLIFGPFGPTTAFWSGISKLQTGFFHQFSAEFHVLPNLVVIFSALFGRECARQYRSRPNFRKNCRTRCQSLRNRSPRRTGEAGSHNITSLTTAMRRALNRERTNVGRTAYTDRVKRMLLSSQSEKVAQVLATDLSNIERSTQHDGWFACTGSGAEDCRNHAA
jgi:hypothetical protein